MSTASRTLLALATLAAAASADLTLGTFDTPAADSTAVKASYNAVAFSNAASSRSLSVADGALILSTTLAIEPGKDYSANAGILVPLNNLWAPVDIRRASAVKFRIKGSGAYNVNFALSSPAYKYGDDGVVMVKGIKVTSAWQAVTINLSPVCDLAYLTWMDDAQRFPGGVDAKYTTDVTDPDYNDESINVAKSVTALQFALDPTWKGGAEWTAPATGATTLSIDDITILDIGVVEPPENICAMGLPSVTFATLKSDRNEAGGYWYAYTDTGASGLAKGTSSLRLPAGARAWQVDTVMGAAVLQADLSRPSTSVYGGFAAIGTNPPEGTQLDLTGLQAISFPIAVAPGAVLDSTVKVRFKVGKASVGDSATHEVILPNAQIRALAGNEICIDVGYYLKMPAWMQGKPEYKPFTPEDVTSLSWEINLVDQTGTVNAAPNQGIQIGAVTFHGLSTLPAPVARGVGVGARPVRSAFSVTYAHGLLSAQGLEGYQTLDVLSLAGARVASVPVGAATRLRLDRGAYLLVARGEGKAPLTRTLAVAR